MRPSRRLLAAATTAFTLLLVPVGLAAAPADARAAAARDNALSPGRLANIALSEAGSFARSQTALRAAETSHPQLGIGDVDTVLSTAAERTRPGCHSNDLQVATTWRSLCWSQADDAARFWYPQGLTGSGDSAGTTPFYSRCAGCPVRKALAVSWHSTGDTLAKITFVDISNAMADAPYEDALLVVPNASAAGYSALHSHASGVSWYGRYLYLFSSGSKSVQVFDVTRIWAVNNPEGTGVGCDPASGLCSAAGMRYALPRVGYYRFADGFGCWGRIGLNPCFSSVALDRKTTPDTLVTTEFNAKSGGRIVRWPLDSRTGRLRPVAKRSRTIVPIAGWKSALRRQQGAAFYGRNGVVAALCPPATSAPGSSSVSCLYRATLSSTQRTARLTTTYWTTVPRGTQNIAYWPASGELWTLNEYPGVDPANPSGRQVLALDCPLLVCT
jgi:hypothetical protein